MALDPSHPAFAEQPPRGADPQRPSADLLLWAYAHGLFPMADPHTDRIGWYSPDPRGVFLLEPEDAFHIPRNVARAVRKNEFEIRSDTAFETVIRECAAPRSADTEADPEAATWLNEQLIAAYVELHRRGHAHSIEAWRDGALVGGLYGVQIGGAYFGESMFSRPERGGSNSSKVCLVLLVRHLRDRGFALLDTQFWNEHLDQFGCVEIPAAQYEAMLNAGIRRDVRW